MEKRNLRIRKCRVDLQIASPDGDQRIKIYADSSASSKLLQSWIMNTLDAREFRTYRYNLVEMDYVLDAKSNRSSGNVELRFNRFWQYCHSTANYKLVLTLHRSTAKGGDLQLSFFIPTSDDISVFALYLRSGLAEFAFTIQCFCKRAGSWEPWIESVPVRKDRADALTGMDSAKVEKVLDFASRTKAGEDLIAIPVNKYCELKMLYDAMTPFSQDANQDAESDAEVEGSEQAEATVEQSEQNIAEETFSFKDTVIPGTEIREELEKSAALS